MDIFRSFYKKITTGRAGPEKGWGGGRDSVLDYRIQGVGIRKLDTFREN